MKTLFITLLVAVATAVLTHLYLTEHGFVLLAYGTRSLQMSLQYLIPLSIIALVALYLLVRFVIEVFTLPHRLKTMNERRLAERDRKGLQRGLIELAEGRFAKAERLLARSARRGDAGLLSYLAAARAAQMQGAYDRRDDYLRWAIEGAPKADVAVSLTQAELQLEHDQLEQALVTLNHLDKLAPRHGYVLRLLAQLHHRLEDWQALMELLPTLRRRKLLDEEELDRLEADAVAAELAAAAHGGDSDTLHAVWKRLPKASRTREDLIALYAEALIKLGDHDDAGSLLRQALARRWDERLVDLFGQVQFASPDRALREGESWTKTHGEDAALLLALGRVAAQAKLWGKARAYFDSSLAIHPRAEAYYELARLSETLEEPENADAYYRAGLKLAATGHAETVRLGARKRESLPRPRAEGDEEEIPDIHPV